MSLELSSERSRAYAEFVRFAAEEVAPHADAIDVDERIPPELVRRLAAAGYLGFGLGGVGGAPRVDPVTHGLLHEALGHASASVQGLVNVHNMAAHALARWGSAVQRERWLPALAAGTRLAGFAISERAVGSDAQSVETSATRVDDGWVLTGRKRWITCGQNADLFVVLARCEGQPTAFVIERGTPGFASVPIRGLLGCRGYMLAELHLDECFLPADHLLARPGVGLSHVAATGLDAGRYYLAWGCVGIARACLEASVRHANGRRQFGAPLREFQLVQKMITEMAARVEAARLLCLQAGLRRTARAASAIVDTAMAKYVASTSLNEVTSRALQIHGALGCSAEAPVQRYLRDAKIMEVIEGTTQILEAMIGTFVCRRPTGARANQDTTAGAVRG